MAKFIDTRVIIVVKMKIHTTIKQLFTTPSILRPYKHIYLLSHMRANTSLFGHILGEHPSINGYYEMHIGYYSWRSKLRQKILYAQEHELKVKSEYFFDKILHNGHHISREILNQRGVIPIFSLRSPEQTIPSILKLFENKPSHECHSKEGAIDYYLERVAELTSLCRHVDNFIYIDANAIRQNTKSTLLTLTDRLGLKSPLNEDFKPKKLTGVGTSGDLSGNLLSGKVNTKVAKYDDIELCENESNALNYTYHNARNLMIKNAEHSIINQAFSVTERS